MQKYRFTRFRLLLFLLGYCTLSASAEAGRPVWATRLFKPLDGLAHQVVRDVALAPDGTYWMATWGGGISRFDGSKWETINEEKTLSDFMIRCLMFDRDGSLWVGTPEGIRHFDGRQWRVYTSENTPELKEDSVFVIHQRRNGEIWFGMLDGYIYSFDSRRPEDHRWQLVRDPELFDRGPIRSFLELEDGSIWVGGDHLYHFDGSAWTRYPMNQVAFALCRTSQGEIYSAETNGVYRFYERSWRFVPEAGQSPRNLGLAPDGSLMVGTVAGTRVLQGGKWADFELNVEEPAPYVEVIRTFANGSTWVGTRSGAYLIYPSDWTIFQSPMPGSPVPAERFLSTLTADPKAVLPDGRIFQLTEEGWGLTGDLGERDNPVVEVLAYSGNRIVVRRERSITDYDAVTLAQTGSIEVSRPEDWATLSLSGTRQWDRVILSGDGTYLWCKADEERILQWNGAEWLPSERNLPSGNPVTFCKETDDGRFWIVSNNRVWASGQRIPGLDVLGAPQNRGHRVTDIFVASDGSAWISTSGSGLFVYDGKGVVHWNSRNALPSNWVRCVSESSDRTIWVGMEDSTLASYRDGRWVSFARRDFQSEGAVTGIREGPGGRMWCVLESGHILRYEPSKAAPDTAIDLYPAGLAPLGKAVFSFHGWDSSHVTLPEDLVFSWRIVDAAHDREVVPWTPYSGSTTISSSPLNPGDYFFEVRAADKERNVDPSPAGVAFTVESYLYLKPAFWLVVLPTTFLVLFLAVRLVQARRKLLRLARIDSLTEAFKRDYFTLRLDAEIQRSKRYDRGLSIILLDLDDFKGINDRYGHDVGDQVLRAIGKGIAEGCRASDSLARWGGEEFLLLLPETGLSEAGILAERIRKKVESTVTMTEHGPVRCTISIGVAQLSGQLPDSDRLLKAADRAMYQAKQDGRNRVRLAGPADGES